ncbi:hypothetical protein [Caballeronia sp. GACF4]|uniref:hypothetical protein n=1 Tax=Caballeronia sp. GACF4 TaxID=2921763 RepID=UPI00202867EB|nr:hypothetical protein [Caballeronia sp. GACF4]
MYVKDYPTGRREIVKFDPAGEEIVVRRLILFGARKGNITIADDFNAPLPDELLGAFEGH